MSSTCLDRFKSEKACSVYLASRKDAFRYSKLLTNIGHCIDLERYFIKKYPRFVVSSHSQDSLDMFWGIAFDLSSNTTHVSASGPCNLWNNCAHQNSTTYRDIVMDIKTKHLTTLSLVMKNVHAFEFGKGASCKPFLHVTLRSVDQPQPSRPTWIELRHYVRCVVVQNIRRNMARTIANHM